MFDTDCDCSFKFCGPEAKEEVVGERRRFSRSFLQRAQATARARSLTRSSGGHDYAERAFAPVWRALDDELAKKEPYLRVPP
jgi:hypothetical protein